MTIDNTNIAIGFIASMAIALAFEFWKTCFSAVFNSPEEILIKYLNFSERFSKHVYSVLAAI